jgi:hypothetical protein
MVRKNQGLSIDKTTLLSSTVHYEESVIDG